MPVGEALVSRPVAEAVNREWTPSAATRTSAVRVDLSTSVIVPVSASCVFRKGYKSEPWKPLLQSVMGSNIPAAS